MQKEASNLNNETSRAGRKENKAQKTGPSGPTGKRKRTIQPTLASFMNVRSGLEGPAGNRRGNNRPSGLPHPMVLGQGLPSGTRQVWIRRRSTAQENPKRKP